MCIRDRALGAEVILHGFDAIQRYKKLYELVEERGYSLVHSYNDPILIAGQGTVGYEIIEDLKEVDTIVVPLGGGGILSGVAPVSYTHLASYPRQDGKTP